MTATTLSDLIRAHYVAHAAADLNTSVRAYPHGELLIIVEDRMQYGTRGFALKGSLIYKQPARDFVDLVIARGGFSTIPGAFGGSMHRLQAADYAAIVADLRATDPIVLAAAGAGPDYWPQAFAQVAG